MAPRPRGKRDTGEDSLLVTGGILVALMIVTFLATYTAFNAIYKAKTTPDFGDEDDEDLEAAQFEGAAKAQEDAGEDCCRGIPNWELWGDSVRWGPNNKKDTAAECCESCKELCPTSGSCECNAWVYCPSEEECGESWKQCWLKHQKNPMAVEVHSGGSTPWMSGLVFQEGTMGIIGLETSHGVIRIQLLPQHAPHVVRYILDLLRVKGCTDCQFYRAEAIGTGWDSEGDRINENPPGPPYALLQGSLRSEEIVFEQIDREAKPIVKRGHVCLIGGGPDFFISLGHHSEWGHGHTVFGQVLDSDMALVNKIVDLPTKDETWGEIKVTVLKEPIPFQIINSLAATKAA